MKKIVRLTETDVQRLVKKIIREEKKSINEGGLFDWVRSKRFSDEELGRSILKGIQKGGISRINRDEPERGAYGSSSGYNFELGGHKIHVRRSYMLSPGGGSEFYYLKVDDESLDVSDRTIEKILDTCYDIVLGKPRENKIKNLKTSLNRYNIPDEERNKIEDVDSIFRQLEDN